MKTGSLLDRAIYSYADVDRLTGLTPGTARRWLEGHERAGVFYEPVLRLDPTGQDSVTWGEMVEARLLAEFRGQQVSLQRLRPSVVRLRQEFGRTRWPTRARCSTSKAASWCAGSKTRSRSTDSSSWSSCATAS